MNRAAWTGILVCVVMMANEIPDRRTPTRSGSAGSGGKCTMEV
ncbi:MAG: hypothetical protein ACK6DZ_15945 [Acidobacteriota bacterium]